MAKITLKKGCSLGCGTILLILVIAVTSSLTAMNRQYNQTAAARDTLIEKFGERGDFNPGSGLAIPTDRLKTFVVVRRQLAGDFGALQGGNQAIRAKEEASGQMGKRRNPLAMVSSTLFGTGNQLINLGSYAKKRNKALVKHGMGLGEYAWIYSLVYYGCLGEKPAMGGTKEHPGFIPPKAREDLARMMLKRAEALTTRGEEASSGEALIWQIAAEELAENPYAVPFEGQAPNCVSSCVGKYGETLAKLFSPGSDPLELMKLKKLGLGFEDE